MSHQEIAYELFAKAMVLVLMFSLAAYAYYFLTRKD